jgi:hypothetical protein
MAETITEAIQQEFANRVLRPEISEMQLERLTEETVTKFVEELQKILTQFHINIIFRKLTGMIIFNKLR